MARFSIAEADMARIWICRKCKARNAAGVSKCRKCGSKYLRPKNKAARAKK